LFPNRKIKPVCSPVLYQSKCIFLAADIFNLYNFIFTYEEDGSSAYVQMYRLCARKLFFTFDFAPNLSRFLLLNKYAFKVTLMVNAELIFIWMHGPGNHLEDFTRDLQVATNKEKYYSGGRPAANFKLYKGLVYETLIIILNTVKNIGKILRDRKPFLIHI
jgi:hypothetical protein